MVEHSITVIRTILLSVELMLAAQAQSSVQWDVGTTVPVQGFLPDPCTGGSIQIPVANQQTVAGYSAEYQTFRWGPQISCQLFGVSGPGVLTVEYEDPSVTGAGQRSMVFSVNYVNQTPVDIFSQCGANVPCSTTIHTTGPILLTCTADPTKLKPNCIVMGLKWVPDSSGGVVASPKFVTDSFSLPTDPAGQLLPVTFTLSKTPIPASGMLLYYSTDNVGEERASFTIPSASTQLVVTPEKGLSIDTPHTGTLQVAYWSSQ